uniref:Uncharacterized protein n=1 Tax=Tetraselmis sp. GSL018 TaxID=582737 RepID=A0A061SEB3_9CHLO
MILRHVWRYCHVDMFFVRSVHGACSNAQSAGRKLLALSAYTNPSWSPS